MDIFVLIKRNDNYKCVHFSRFEEFNMIWINSESLTSFAEVRYYGKKDNVLKSCSLIALNRKLNFLLLFI